jgi:thioredoxin reductase
MWLGRYRRKTLLVDSSQQRNLAALRSHGYLTRDGASPHELLEAANEDVRRYPTVEIRRGAVTDIRRQDGVFAVTVDGEDHLADRILLATGVEDTFPEVEGFRELYGKAMFHCPCCDGYEARDKDVLAIGWGEHVAGYSLDLLDWGARVTVVTNGEKWQGDDACSVALSKHRVEISEEKIASFRTDGDELLGVELESGRFIPAALAFFSIAHRPRTGLARSLGCEIDEEGYVAIDAHGETTVDGVYAAGDVTPGEQLVQVAAAQGAIAGIACAMSLRGAPAAPGAPDPGPDPEAELPA